MIIYQDSVWTIFQSELFKTNTAVICLEEIVLIVDPNLLPSEVFSIKEFVDSIRKDKEVWLLFTHSDWDHIIGYGAFEPDTVIASENFRTNVGKDQKVKEASDFDAEFYIQRPYELTFPQVQFSVKEDDVKLKTGDSTLTFYLANGHTDDGLIAIVEPEGILIAGDYLSDLEFPFIYHQSEAYRQTLEKIPKLLEQHSVKYLLPGHGALAIGQQEILRRCNRDLTYIRTLRHCMANGLSFPLDEWLAKFDFKAALRKEHLKNEELMRREFNF